MTNRGYKEFLSGGGRIFPPPSQQESARKPFADRDLTDHDELEQWIAEQLHDWRLLTEGSIFERIRRILQRSIDEVETRRALVSPDDLQQSGYLDGQANAFSTVQLMMASAVSNRRSRVGEAVEKPSP